MHYFEESNTLSLHLPASPVPIPIRPSSSSSCSLKSSLTIIVHPYTFRAGKGVRKIEVDCDGQMELGQLVKKIIDRKVEMFQRKNENLEKVKQSSKAKHFDRKTIECFEIRKQGEEYVNLMFKVFKAIQKSDKKSSTNWINVTVRNDDENQRIYYIVFRHLFGISNYVNKIDDEESGGNKLYKLFCKSFERKDEPKPFLLKLVCPSVSK
jgi:hypothetical protein